MQNYLRLCRDARAACDLHLVQSAPTSRCVCCVRAQLAAANDGGATAVQSQTPGQAPRPPAGCKALPDPDNRIFPTVFHSPMQKH